MVQVSLWSIGCADGRDGAPYNPKYGNNRGYMNGYHHGKQVFQEELVKAAQQREFPIILPPTGFDDERLNSVLRDYARKAVEADRKRHWSN